MNNSFFPGQQTDEKVLYYTKPHASVKYISFAKIVFLGLLVLLAFQVVAFTVPFFGDVLRIASLVLTIIIILVGLWWVNSTHEKTEIYVTDRRIVKFAPLTPFRLTTRTLFWDEAVKSKTYHKNAILERMLGIGSIEIHARSQDKDNVDLNHLIYHEDLSNYIDKILYTYKTKPDELKNFKEFVTKPKGQRDG